MKLNFAKRAIPAILAALIVFHVTLTLIMAVVPPVSRDALIHHLAVPRLYIDNGEISEIPEIEFSYYPMNLEMMFLLPMYFGNDTAPKYIHYMFAILTGLVIFILIKQHDNTLYALLGVLLFLSIPVVAKLSITAYVDLGLIFFSFASMFFILKWAGSRFKTSYIIIAGVFCGLCLGTKYNGLIVLFILAASVPFIYSRTADGDRSIPAIKHGIVFTVAALVVFSPWMTRNIIWKANPVYPLFHKHFSNADDSAGSYSESAPGKYSESKLPPFAIRKLVYKESALMTALVPLRIFFQGTDNNPRLFDGKLNPFLLIFPFFAFIGIKNESPELWRLKLFFSFFSIAIILIVFFYHDMRIRYIAPAVPLLCILAVFGIKNLLHHAQNLFLKILIILAVSLMLFLNFDYSINLFKKTAPMGYLTGSESREQYIEKKLPEYAAMKYANENFKQSDVIFGVFIGRKNYYLDRKMIFDINLFNNIFKEAESSTVALNRIRELGVTHLLVGHAGFNKWVNSSYTNDQREILSDFFALNTKVIFKKTGFGLYKLEP